MCQASLGLRAFAAVRPDRVVGCSAAPPPTTGRQQLALCGGVSRAGLRHGVALPWGAAGPASPELPGPWPRHPLSLIPATQPVAPTGLSPALLLVPPCPYAGTDSTPGPSWSLRPLTTPPSLAAPPSPPPWEAPPAACQPFSRPSSVPRCAGGLGAGAACTYYTSNGSCHGVVQPSPYPTHTEAAACPSARHPPLALLPTHPCHCRCPSPRCPARPLPCRLPRCAVLGPCVLLQRRAGRLCGHYGQRARGRALGRPHLRPRWRLGF